MWDPKFKSKAKSKPQETKASIWIPDDWPCPVHPGGTHTWGKCFLNAARKDKKKQASKGKSKDKSKSNVDNSDGNFFGFRKSHTTHIYTPQQLNIPYKGHNNN
jgi:hypothetical protein